MKILNLFKVTNKKDWIDNGIKEDIEKYIEKHNIENYLITLHNKIKEYFGNVDQYLELSEDPEVDKTNLWVRIVTEDIDNDMKILDKFDNEWFLENQNHDPYINIDLYYEENL
ncbi:MAG: hypothetical protein ACOCP8_07815 [archaeon]